MKEQTIPQQPKQNQGSKIILMVVLTIIATALVVGVGIYVWQNSQLNLTQKKYQQKNTELQNQLTQLQSEYGTWQNRVSDTDDVNDGGYELINTHCSLDECLFNIGSSNYPLGSSVIKGYSSPVERSGWGETKKCDSFTITGGSEELIRAMVDLVDSGNAVHSKNELNQPVINLGLDLLDQTEKQDILNSTTDDQIELIVLSDSPRDAGVPVCYQDVVVLRKK